MLEYKVTNYWSKEHERTLIWNDKTIGIDWNLDKYNASHPILESKDENASTLKKEDVLSNKSFPDITSKTLAHL